MIEREAARELRQGAYLGAVMIVVTIALLTVIGASAPVTIVVVDPTEYVEVGDGWGGSAIVWLTALPIMGGIVAGAGWSMATVGWRPWPRRPASERNLRMHNGLQYGAILTAMLAAAFTRLLVPDTATIADGVLVDIHQAPARIAATMVVTLLTIALGYAVTAWAIVAWLRRRRPGQAVAWMEPRVAPRT